MEKLREAIDGFIIEANRAIYGWVIWLLDLWTQGSNGWLGLALLGLIALVILLFSLQQRSRSLAKLLRGVVEKLAKVSSPNETTSLLFETIFKVTTAPAASLHLAFTASGPFPLKGKQIHPSVPPAAQPEWEPELLLQTIPKKPLTEKKGSLTIISLPLSIEDQRSALLQFAVAKSEEARRIISRAPLLSALTSPIVCHLVALERIQRLEEQSREASVVSGSSQMLLGTTLGPDQLAHTLLDMAIRSTQSDSGLIVLKGSAMGDRGIGIIAPSGLSAGIMSELEAAVKEETFSLTDERSIIDQIQPGSRLDSILARAGFRSLVQAPILHDGSPVGRMVLLKREGGFRESHLRICQLNATRLALTVKNLKYHEEVFSEYKETLRAMVMTLESSNPHLEGHSSRVSRLAQELAKALRLPPAEIEGIRLAGELHDVGMVGLGDEILLRAGRLTDKEYDLVRHHPMIGAALTAPIRLPIPIAPLILHHHERLDGRGYPAGLTNKSIPLGARILALGEVFDAMLTSRSYRQALAFSEAVERLRSLAGTQLDREIVDLFIRTVPEERWRTIAKNEGQ